MTPKMTATKATQREAESERTKTPKCEKPLETNLQITTISGKKKIYHMTFGAHSPSLSLYFLYSNVSVLSINAI